MGKSKSTYVPMPEQLPIEQLERVLRYGKEDGFSLEEVEYGVKTIRAWAMAHAKTMVDWPACIRNNMRRGWPLEGFRRWHATRKNVNRSVRGDVILTQIDANTAQAVLTDARKRGHPER